MKMPGGFMLATALLLSCLQVCAAASLRATPQEKPAEPAAKVKAKEAPILPKELVGKVTEKVADTIAKALAAQAPKLPAKAPEAAAAQPVTHKKLDVGFQDFEKNLTEGISEKLLQSASGTAWNDDTRTKFSKNVTDAVKESLKVILKPVKMSIGKTWMALPKDEQKDEYVQTLKNSFESVFENSMKSINSHLELSLKRIEAYSKEQMTSAQLLEKSEFSVGDSLLTEHCYEVDAKKSLKTLKKPANASAILADKKKFCIQSVIGALAHRLNDTQGLISMSMRFDSGAMSLAQKKAKGIK